MHLSATDIGLWLHLQSLNLPQGNRNYLYMYASSLISLPPLATSVINAGIADAFQSYPSLSPSSKTFISETFHDRLSLGFSQRAAEVHRESPVNLHRGRKACADCHRHWETSDCAMKDFALCSAGLFIFCAFAHCILHTEGLTPATYQQVGATTGFISSLPIWRFMQDVIITRFFAHTFPH